VNVKLTSVAERGDSCDDSVLYDPRLDAALDAAESAAGLGRLRSSPRLQWRSYQFSAEVGVEGWRAQEQVYSPFRPKYFLLSTSGFVILSLDVNRTYRLLGGADGDLYLVSEWDRLERESQLERVRLPGATLNYRDSLTLKVAVRNAANLAPEAKIPFRAMVVGEELVEGPY
jgi:hypothetical protein